LNQTEKAEMLKETNLPDLVYKLRTNYSKHFASIVIVDQIDALAAMTRE
jgi:hypothetical protein